MKLCVLAILLAGLPAGAALNGDFTMEPAANGSYRMTLVRSDTMINATRIIEVAASDLKGFDASQADVRFEWTRPQGVFRFEGKAQNGRIAGTFRFQEDSAYVAPLKKTSVRWWESGIHYEAALEPFSKEWRLPQLPELDPAKLLGHRQSADAFKESGYPLLRTDINRLRLHNVSPDLLRQLKLSGYDSMSVTDMVRLKTNGVDSWDLLRFQSHGLTNLNADDMVKLKLDGLPKQ